MKMNILVAVTFGLILLNLNSCHAALTLGFYKGKCGATQDVEAIVRSIVTQRFQKDRTIVAALLRMQFHDCFVQGCDASILIDGPSSEKNTGPNASVRGYELIDQIKTAVEKACRGIVSCADIIALATRDAVALSGGSTFSYALPTGRRDSTVASANNVNLPGPSVSISGAVALFKSKGLTASDMVTLLGAHTVGITHCSFILDRLYNFRNTGRQDPTMDPGLVTVLRRRCPQVSNTDNSVNLDQNTASSNTVDNSFYQQIKKNKGILEIDQRLASDTLSKNTVTALATGSTFNKQFGAAMIKMCGIQVLTGTQGQIRRSCRAFNK